MSMHNSKSIEFEGKIYESYSALARAYNKPMRSGAIIVSRHKNNYCKLFNYLMNMDHHGKKLGVTHKPGEIFGDYKLIEFVKQSDSKNKQALYKFECKNCGHIKISTIYSMKKFNICKECKNRNKKLDKIDKMKNTIRNGYKILNIKLDLNNNTYIFTIECIDCGKQRTFIDKNINTRFTKCECKKHLNEKFKAKHNGEIINGWLLEDTGLDAYNSRNRLYKYTCQNCGKVKYGMYDKNINICKCLKPKKQQNNSIRKKCIKKTKQKQHIESNVNLLMRTEKVLKTLNCTEKELIGYRKIGILKYIKKKIYHEYYIFYYKESVMKLKRILIEMGF